MRYKMKEAMRNARPAIEAVVISLSLAIAAISVPAVIMMTSI
jgi:hypothetical protein